MDDVTADKNVHISVRVANRLDREIEQWRESHGYERSEAVRKLIKRGLDYDDKMDEIEDRVFDLETDFQQLQKRISDLDSRDGAMTGYATDSEGDWKGGQYQDEI